MRRLLPFAMMAQNVSCACHARPKRPDALWICPYGHTTNEPRNRSGRLAISTVLSLPVRGGGQEGYVAFREEAREVAIAVNTLGDEEGVDGGNREGLFEPLLLGTHQTDEELHAGVLQGVKGCLDVLRSKGDMMDAFAVVVHELLRRAGRFVIHVRADARGEDRRELEYLGTPYSIQDRESETPTELAVTS